MKAPAAPSSHGSADSGAEKERKRGGKPPCRLCNERQPNYLVLPCKHWVRNPSSFPSCHLITFVSSMCLACPCNGPKVPVLCGCCTCVQVMLLGLAGSVRNLCAQQGRHWQVSKVRAVRRRCQAAVPRLYQLRNLLLEEGPCGQNVL